MLCSICKAFPETGSVLPNDGSTGACAERRNASSSSSSLHTRVAYCFLHAGVSAYANDMLNDGTQHLGLRDNNIINGVVEGRNREKIVTNIFMGSFQKQSYCMSLCLCFL